jgi:hypothetical protein
MRPESIEPWITTNDRIPYLVFPVGLPEDMTRDILGNCLGKKLKLFTDIYSCQAFALSGDNNNVIFCIRHIVERDECAIIVFIDSPLSLDGLGDFHDPICGLAYRGLETLNRILDRSPSKPQLRILRVDPQEISRKCA